MCFSVLRFAKQQWSHFILNNNTCRAIHDTQTLLHKWYYVLTGLLKVTMLEECFYNYMASVLNWVGTCYPVPCFRDTVQWLFVKLFQLSLSVFRPKGLVSHRVAMSSPMSGSKTFKVCYNFENRRSWPWYVILSELIRQLEINESEVLSPCMVGWVLVLISFMELDNAYGESNYFFSFFLFIFEFVIQSISLKQPVNGQNKMTIEGRRLLKTGEFTMNIWDHKI